MRIVNIIGGLGNQMFQFAFALSLKKRFPEEEVLIDISHFNYIFVKRWGSSNLHNGYELDKLFPNVKVLSVATSDQLKKVTWYMPNYLFSRVLRRLLPAKKSEYIQKVTNIFSYQTDVFEKEGDTYYEGVWESVGYLLPAKYEIQQIFTFPEPKEINRCYVEEMEIVDSVGIHVRRGDYLHHPSFRGICEESYYTKAIEEIKKDGKKHKYYIFSNDFVWCERFLAPQISDSEIEYMKVNTGDSSCWDMFLMTHCKDLIIANSSFSWWGAFLNNRGGRIVAPKTWVNRNAEFDIWLDEWIRI